jgi:phage gpG-like protein
MSFDFNNEFGRVLNMAASSMTLRPNLSASGLRNIEKNFTEDLVNALRASELELARLIRDNFRTRESSWHPLAETTIKQRERLGYPSERPRLSRSGALIQNVVNRRSVTTKNGVIDLMVGTDYQPRGDGISAFVLNYGDPNGFGKGINIPARAFYVLSSDKRRTLRNFIVTKIQENML